MRDGLALRPDAFGETSPYVRATLLVTFVAIVGAFYAQPGWGFGLAGSLYIALHIAFTGAMLIAWRWSAFSLNELVWIGVLLRVALVFADPITSNDSERYLWDGAVALAGFDPYLTAPDNPIVAHLRAVWPTPPEHAQYPTLYPPAAIGIFALVAASGPEWGVWVWKAILAGAGVASLLLMRATLRNYRQDHHFALFALSPLLVLEAGVGAHLDALLVLAVSIMAYAYAHARWKLLGAALGWSVCVKFSPIVVMVPLFWLLRRADFARVAVTAFGVIAAIYGAALLMGLTPIGILPTFFEKWRGGSPVFAALDAGLDGYALLVASALFAAFGVLLSALLAWRRQAALACTLALSVPLIVSPVVFPWYLCALVPLLALRPSATLLLWVTTAPLTYEVLNRWLGEGVWEPATWPVLVVAGGWALGLAIDGYSKRVAPAGAALTHFRSSNKEPVQ